VRTRSERAQSTRRLFVTYAALLLVPVVVLGVTLAASYRSEARQRGVSEGRSEAVLIAQTAIEPLLSGRPLNAGLTKQQISDLDHVVDTAVHGHDILRLRLRDLSGQVVFSDDGSGFTQRPEDEALDAAEGETVARLTHLNSDSNDEGPEGPEVVEVYLPLNAGSPPQRVGVLEIYLPYAPISQDVTAGIHNLYVDLALGLGALYIVLFVISVSVTRRLRRQVKVTRYMAEHDTLTDLPNRTLFHRQLKETLSSSDTTTAIAIIDLDRFKEVNDTLGHHNGDELLTQLAWRLADSTRPSDVVARLGGDEFGLVLTDVRDADEALHRLRQIIQEEIEISGLPLSPEASIGYVLAPWDGTAVDELLQRAEVAMYVAKASYQGVVRYRADQDQYDAGNLGLVAQLRRAIDNEELVLYYQPKATLGDRHITAVEALVRWRHPAEGLVYPDRFVPLAEQTDLIDKLTTWVLRRALLDIADLAPEGAGISVAVNVSARNLARPAFADDVLSTLESVGVAPQRLIIEITETALLTDPQRAAYALARLGAAGIRVSLDDFGVGQTSLAYLSTLTVHELKIDRCFVADVLENHAHEAIVRSIIDLGHNLSLTVVAEGVEMESIFEFLRENHCDLAQGYLIARPMPVAQLHQFLTTVPLEVPSIR
jgi:diguanylate cyclase (GGDEF)-like protein